MTELIMSFKHQNNMSINVVEVEAQTFILGREY